MDIYTNPDPNTYRLYTPFQMPHDNGGSQHAIAVTQNQAAYLVAAYSVLVTLLFSAAWTNITNAVLIHRHRRAVELNNIDPNQYIGLIGFFNAREPWTTIAFIWHYRKSASTRGWAFGIFVISLFMYYGGMVAGVLVPNQLLIGNLAPADPYAVFFYTASASSDFAEAAKVQALKAPAAMRAVGSVEAAKVTLRDRVTVTRPSEANIGVDELGNPIVVINYSYEVSGWDFGLQNAPQLQQRVQGSCRTEYSWYQSHDPEFGEKYYPWNMKNETRIVSTETTEVEQPPWAEIIHHPAAIYTFSNYGNYSYGLIPNLAGRRTFTTSKDVWYSTMDANNTSKDSNPAPYAVMSKRPALSCWQADTWAYNGQTVNSVRKLDQLHGFKPTSEWTDHFQLQLGSPKVIDLGISMGRSILVSATTYLGRYFDAGSSSLHSDLERLLLASFVSSRDIFRDTTMIDPPAGMSNGALNAQGQPAAGVADFVLSSGDISTVSIATLVAVPAVLLGLWLVKFGFMLVLGCSSKKDDYKRLEGGLEATQLYRSIHHCTQKTASTPAKDSGKWKREKSAAPIWESTSGQSEGSSAFPKKNWLWIATTE